MSDNGIICVIFFCRKYLDNILAGSFSELIKQDSQLNRYYGVV